MIDQLPDDQAEKILYEIGESKAQEIGREAKNITAFYAMCLQAMGGLKERPRSPQLPSPTVAWMQVWRQRKKPEGSVELSHPKIGETVEYFGGWSKMWLDASKREFAKFREHWQIKYRDIAGA